jgi:hypothetical protein
VGSSPGRAEWSRERSLNSRSHRCSKTGSRDIRWPPTRHFAVRPHGNGPHAGYVELNHDFLFGTGEIGNAASDRMLPAKFQRGKAFAKGAPENPFNICGIGAEFTRQYCSSPKRALRRHSPPHPALSAPKGGEGNDSLSNTCRRFTGPCRPRLPWRGRRPPAACRRPSPRASALPRPRSVGYLGAASWRRRAGPCPGAPP